MRISEKTLAIEGDLHELKLIAEALDEFARKRGVDLPNRMSDLCFNINTEYQRSNERDQDDWDMTQEDKYWFGLEDDD